MTSVAVTDLIEQPMAENLKKLSDRIQRPGGFGQSFLVGNHVIFVVLQASVKKTDACSRTHKKSLSVSVLRCKTTQPTNFKAMDSLTHLCFSCPARRLAWSHRSSLLVQPRSQDSTFVNFCRCPKIRCSVL